MKEIRYKNISISQTKNGIELFESGKMKTTAAIRKHLTRIHGYCCSKCGISDYNSEPITLHVDHIDGNCLNNMPDNVRLLCPNCHSQSLNWGARNKGFGRQSRGLKR